VAITTHDFLKNWKRMCASFDSCEECPLSRSTPWGKEACINDGIECIPDDAVEIVERWMMESSQPMYETWHNYLVKQGVISIEASLFDINHAVLNILQKTHIRPDIAEKLGLDPIGVISEEDDADEE